MLTKSPILSAETSIRNRIAALVGPQKFKVWFKNSTQLDCADGFVKVGVPNLFIGNWIENHFSDAIAQAAREALGKDVHVSFSIDPLLFRKMRKDQLNSQAAYIEKNAQRAPRNGAAFASPRRLRGRLESFVIGPNNRLAYSLAQSVVENPTTDTGHLFFHGGCGLGKTHLLHGIGNALTEKHPQARWLYATGEEFTNQFLLALRTRHLEGFRHRFRDLDVLLLDDVQFLANKRATQDEFLHTFNAIHDAGMRIVMASDAHPKMIGDLPASLVNRLVAGMVVRIEPPDFETRCEILRRRAAATPQQIPDAVIAYIAERIKTNVRELEGCLLKLIACASLMNQPITPALARLTLEDHVAQTRKILTVSDIEASVATFFGLSPADLHTSRKSRTIALARNIAMLLARKHTGLSFPEIGRLMGNKDHTTVLLACRRMQKILDAGGEVAWQSVAGPVKASLAELIERQEHELMR